MSIYQFSTYLSDIAEIEKMFHGDPNDKSSGTKALSNKEIIERARQKGFITPKHY